MFNVTFIVIHSKNIINNIIKYYESKIQTRHHENITQTKVSLNNVQS